MTRGSIVCTFDVSGSTFALDAKHVVSIEQSVEAVPLPCAEDHIQGMVNIRGTVAYAVDTGKRLGINSSAAAGTSVVARYRGGMVALRVHDVYDVHVVDSIPLEPVPHGSQKGPGCPLLGVYRIHNMVVPLLDPGKLLGKP